MPLLRFVRPLGVIAFAFTATGAFLPMPPSVFRHPPPLSPALDTAIARMGGEETLRRIERVRFELMTLWQRMSFDKRPADVISSYELDSDLRNYSLGAWRNTRRFVGGPTLREMTDIVQQDVGIRRIPKPDGTFAPWSPISIAYVDERKEVFAFAPDRLLLAARAASDLRILSDTTLVGQPHARVSATVDGFPTTLFLRRSDGFLGMARYHAAQLNDFGLAPWGDMEVEVWYSGWSKYPFTGAQTVVYPRQWDIRRVGQMYKRLTVVAANFDAAAPPDSFAISDSLRAAFASGSASRPMWDLPMDSAKVLEPRLARFGLPGQAQAAVKFGNQWLMLEGTGVPQRNDTDMQWLRTADPGSGVAGLLVTIPTGGRGGAAWFASHKLPVYVAPGATAAMAATMVSWKQPRSAITTVVKPQWLRIAGDSVWLETIDLPDFPGVLIAYVPSMRWAYSGLAASPFYLDAIVTRIRDRGWTVDRVGSLRSLTQPLPGRTASR